MYNLQAIWSTGGTRWQKKSMWRKRNVSLPNMGITPFPNWDSGSTESTHREKISQITEASRRPTELTVSQRNLRALKLIERITTISRTTIASRNKQWRYSEKLSREWISSTSPQLNTALPFWWCWRDVRKVSTKKLVFVWAASSEQYHK